MFTGIVDHCGRIKGIDSRKNGVRLRIDSRFSRLAKGESISVDGACLTVVDPKRHTFYCDLSQETLNRTIFKNLREGASVNLERPLRLNDPMGGHFVLGHVDSMAQVKKVKGIFACREIWFKDISPQSRKFLIPKGSVTINGVSLTVNEVKGLAFSIMLIPHTLKRTNLSSIKRGSWVNVEWDWLAKTVYFQRKVK